MREQHHILGTLCVVFGVLIFFLFANTILFQLAMIFLAYKVINFGLEIQGKPSFMYYIKSWTGFRGF